MIQKKELKISDLYCEFVLKNCL